MNILEAQKVLIATHVSAVSLLSGSNDYSTYQRPSSMMWQSGPGAGKSQAIRQMCEMLCLMLKKPIGLVVEFLATLASVDIRGFGLPVRDPNTGVVNMVFSTPPWFPSHDNTWVCAPVDYDSGGSGGAASGRDDNGRGFRWFAPRANQGLYAAFSLQLSPTAPRWADQNNNPLPLPEIGVLFLDEWGQAEDDVKKPAAELLLNGAVGNTSLPPLWRVVGATNRTTDRSGVLRELMFTVNRRCLQKITPTVDGLVTHLTSLPSILRPHHMTISFIQTHPSIVLADAVPDKPDPFCTPRSTVMMDRDLRAIRTGKEIEEDLLPTSDLAREICEGWIGDAASAQFFTHLKYFDLIPTMPDIVADPTKAKLPTEQSAQLVVAYQLAHHVDSNNAEAVVIYMSRLTREMQIACVKATRGSLPRAKAINNAPGFSDWLHKNQDMLMAVSF